MKPLPTPDEALEILKKHRECQREYQRERQRRPEVAAKRREYQRKIFAGYKAAKKAGLVE